jgi:hypothetical protein
VLHYKASLLGTEVLGGEASEWRCGRVGLAMSWLMCSEALAWVAREDIQKISSKVVDRLVQTLTEFDSSLLTQDSATQQKF